MNEKLTLYDRLAHREEVHAILSILLSEASVEDIITIIADYDAYVYTTLANQDHTLAEPYTFLAWLDSNHYEEEDNE